MTSNFSANRISFIFVMAAIVIHTPSTHGWQSAAPLQAASAARPTLDYEFFKTRAQPIFLKKRSEAHARCYACHEREKKRKGLTLEPLSPGSSFWTEEQSRRNFQVVSQFVVPGAPLSSFFLIHPLAPEAGGDAINAHGGGSQFESQNNPDWQTLADWVRGKKASGSSEAGSKDAPKSMEGDPARGKAIFAANSCEICHDAHSDTDKVGPGLLSLFKKGPHKLADGTEHKEHTIPMMRDQIVKGSSTMPPVGAFLSSQEIEDLIAYLKTL